MNDLPIFKLFSKRQSDRVIFNRIDQSRKLLWEIDDSENRRDSITKYTIFELLLK